MRSDIVVEGTVVKVLPNGFFVVELPGGSHKVTAALTGKMRHTRNRKSPKYVEMGDVVKMELCKYDLERGRIVYNLTSKDKKWNK